MQESSTPAGNGSERQEQGRLGGNATKEKYGPDHYSRIGQMGGSTTARRHGTSHYSRIGKLHGKRVEEPVEVSE